jgi:hypothetical protein
MQGELQDAFPRLDIQIIGVNAFGQEIGNTAMTSGRDLPWLQDQDQNGDQRSDVWDESWAVTYRDVVILDGANQPTDAFNLTTHDLADPAEYEALHDLLVQTAVRDQQPWSNPNDILDANNDEQVSADDVYLLFDVMNQIGSYELPELADGETASAYYDCNVDGFLAPVDALWIINFLNSQEDSGAGVEGEASLNVSSATPQLVQIPYTLREDASISPPQTPSLIDAGGSDAADETDESQWRLVLPDPTHDTSSRSVTATGSIRTEADLPSDESLGLSPLDIDQLFSVYFESDGGNI